MRIGLNLLHALPEIGGGWTYIANLVAALGRDDGANEYIAYTNAASAALVPRRPAFRVEEIDIRSGNRIQRILYEHSVLQARVWRDRLDCLHWFANGAGIVNAAPPVVTVYDLQPFLPYALLSPPKRAFLRWRIRAAVRQGAALLPMSQATADDLHATLGADRARMTVVPPVLEPTLQPAPASEVERIRERYGLPTAFWLYVAHMYPHKNHHRLLDAYRTLKRRDPGTWPLVLRGDRHGAPFEITDVIASLDLVGDVIVLPSLARDELPALYGAASALVFPTLYEGGGLPVLEALACGCPVAGSSIPAVREFAGDAAHYFDPLDTADIERAMIALASDAGMRSRLREAGLARADVWRQVPIAKRLVAAYQQAGASRHHLRQQRGNRSGAGPPAGRS